MAGKNTDNIRCSFCNKTQSQVKKMIAGPAGVYICDECVRNRAAGRRGNGDQSAQTGRDQEFPR